MASAERTTTVTLTLTDDEADALLDRLGNAGSPSSWATVLLNDAVYFALKRITAPF